MPRSDSVMNSDPISETQRCFAFCDAASFDFHGLTNKYKATGTEFTEFRKGSRVIHIKLAKHSDVFIFLYGAVVTWGLPPQGEQELRDELKKYQSEPSDFFDTELYSFCFGDSPKIVGGNITIPSDDILLKLAISHGFAQSVKLGSFEKRIENRIESTKFLAESLALRGRIPLRMKDITKMQGSVFLDRSLVNLRSDILDTPEFFWEHPEVEPLYTMTANDLDIKSRVSVLNKRMDILKDLFEMLGDELHARHSSFLEITIVVLILAEILLALAKEFFNFG